MSNDRNAPRFYSLAACLLAYEIEGQARQRYMNVVCESPTKNISSSALNNARLALLHRFQLETGLETSVVKDLVFLAISPLGLMPPNKFHDMQPDAPEGVRPN